MKLFKILTVTCVVFLFACSKQNPELVLTEKQLAEAIANHFTVENEKAKRFENLEIKVINTEESDNQSKPVYKATYQVSGELAEDLYQLKSKQSCNNNYVTYKLLHPKGSKHVINGLMVAVYSTGAWDYAFKNDNELEGSKLPEAANLFRADSLEEIDFIKQTCLEKGEQQKEAVLAELKATVIVINDEAYDKFLKASESIDGKEIYATVCASCHDTGVSGSPRIDDKNAWHPKLDTVKKALLQNILIPEGSRHPAAGKILLSEAEILASINYILNRLRKNQAH
ncbi:MAG: hypothetical protein HKP55_10750 [Gammaproteobacteria bacterium]|nr:c-type cytochrome [Gammaproteobacteria bacterium]NNJ92146.1 hypothetical protein [Gammaproteobacteria bacterium]